MSSEYQQAYAEGYESASQDMHKLQRKVDALTRFRELCMTASVYYEGGYGVRPKLVLLFKTEWEAQTAHKEILGWAGLDRADSGHT
jgi:hypothetical protein